MIFGSESAGAKNESNRRTEPNRDAECVGESLYAPLGRADSSWAISESARGYLALMSGCVPAIICLSLGHESGLCWVMERRRVAPHSGTAPRTDVGREPRTLRRRVLEPRSRSGFCRLRRVHQPF
jgi:hypothetical protein